MNQRREERVVLNQPVWVTLFGEVETRIPGVVRNVAGRGLGLELGQAAGTGAALKIELRDSLLLGEVIYCRKEGDRYYAGVELEQALYGLVKLGEMMRGFSGEPSGPQHVYAVHETGRQDK